MLAIKSIYNVFKREVNEIAHNGLYFTSLIVLPIVVISLFTLMFFRGSVEQLPIAVVNNDHSVMSRQLIAMLEASRGIGDISEVYTMEDANRLIRGGEVRAIVVIPNDFERSITSGNTTEVISSISGANLSTAGVLKRDIQQVVQSFSAGVAASRLNSIGYSNTQAMVDVMPINVHIHTISNPYMNYGYYLAPMFMFVGMALFIVLNTIYAIGRELRYSTTQEWISAARGSLLSAMIGKLLPTTIVMIAMMMAIYFALFVIMGMEVMCSWLMFSFSSLMLILAYQSVAVVTIALTANMRLALSLGGGYAVMAFTFSGITFPTLSMYGVAQLLAKLFPLSYFSDIFITQALRGADVSYSIDSFVYLGIFSLLWIFVWPRLSRVVCNEQYWRRD